MKHVLAMFVILYLVSAHGEYVQISSVELRQQRLEEVGNRPALSKLTIGDRLLVLHWLSLDCAVNSEEWERHIKAAGQRLETAFLESYTLGPPKADLAVNQDLLKNQYDDIQEVIGRAGATLFGDDMARSLRGISYEEYVRRELARRHIAYKSSALTGLGLIGSKGIINDLKKITETAQEPIATSARQAIRSIEERERPRL